MRPEAELEVPAVLTIAGSDSGGGAGLQADLKVFHALGCFGVSAVSCVTAQNPDAVLGVEAVSPEMVADQVRAVCDGFPVKAAKTGMLFSSRIIEAVAGVVGECGIGGLVVDPVMVSTSGKRLLQDDAVVALRELLIPRATVITPNLPEAEVLAGHAIGSQDELKDTAAELGELFGVACALKGGHLDGCAECVVDVLYAAGEVQVFETPRVRVAETHGTGCSFAAVVAAELAKGSALSNAVGFAQRFVAQALANAIRVGEHSPLGV